MKRLQNVSFSFKFLYIGWSFLIAIIAIIATYNAYNYAVYVAHKNAKTIVDKDLAFRSWGASHGGVYVPVDKNTPPNPYLSHIPHRDFEAIGKKFTLMNPAYILRQMMQEYTKLYGVETHITSKNLLNPNNAPDKWEEKALDIIAKTKQQYYELETLKNKPYFRLMNPLITKKSCLKCHAFQGYKVGDLRGGVSVSIPMEPLYDDAKKNSLMIIFLMILVWLIGLVLIYKFQQYIQNQRNKEEKQYEEYIYGLVDIVEKRDSYTAGHSKRVAKYAKMIAQELHFSKEKCEQIYRAGMLHDIGKIGIPDSVFLKPTKLNENEYKLIKEHVVLSYELLSKISIFDDIKEIVKNHHEMYNGKGYPRGLKGDEIPLEAQILALADSFDAMTTDRIYKGRKSVKEALEEIQRLSGVQFHPVIANIAQKVLKDVQPDTASQAPSSQLEEERFSYFYKDPLTGIFNEAYLRIDIHTLKDYSYLCWISLQNFHLYNKKYGWKQGDHLLQQIASTIMQDQNVQLKAYRFFGDNFLILSNDEIYIHQIKEKIELLIQTFELSIKYSIKETAEISTTQNTTLEDVLQQLN